MNRSYRKSYRLLRNVLTFIVILAAIQGATFGLQNVRSIVNEFTGTHKYTPPGDPDKPDKPTDPDKPDKPTDPDKPDRPTDPDKPGEPEEPHTPIDPTDPPTGPGFPPGPETPDKPETPDTPDRPTGPGNPPKTGDGADARPWLTILVVSAYLLRYVLFIRKKNKKGVSNNVYEI